MAERDESSAVEPTTEAMAAEDVAVTTTSASSPRDGAGPLVLSREEEPIRNGLASLMDDSSCQVGDGDEDGDYRRGSSGSVKIIREKFNSPRHSSGSSLIDVDMNQFYKKQRAQSVTYQQKKKEASVTNSRLSIVSSPSPGTSRSSLQENIDAIKEMKLDEEELSDKEDEEEEEHDNEDDDNDKISQKVKVEESPKNPGDDEQREMEGGDKEEKEEDSPIIDHSSTKEEIQEQSTKTGSGGEQQSSNNHLEESVSAMGSNRQDDAENAERGMSDDSCKDEEREEAKEDVDDDDDSYHSGRRPSPVSTFFDKRLTTFANNIDVIKTEAGALASLLIHHKNRYVAAMDHHRESPSPSPTTKKSDLEEQ